MEKEKSLSILNDWINTPFSYLEQFAGKTNLAQDIMMKVSESIQEYIAPFFDEGRHKDKVKPNPLFSAEDRRTLKPIVIRLADYGISGHYDRVEAAVKAILESHIKIETPLPGGKRVRWYNIFKNSLTDYTDKGYTFINKDGEKETVSRSKGYVVFEINEDVADLVFDMSKGYINHPVKMARISSATHTTQLYALLKHHCINGKCKLTVNEIKKYLGLCAVDENGDVTSWMFPYFYHFRKNVLDKVQADLTRMGELGQIDYTYTYKEIRQGGKTKGDPDSIEFTLVPTIITEQVENDRAMQSKRRKLINTLCKRCGDLNRKEVKDVTDYVKEVDFLIFADYCYKEIPMLIEKNYPEDVAGYILYLMRTWIENYEARKNKQPITQSLFDTIEPERPKETVIEGKYAVEWERLCNECPESYKEWLRKATFIGGRGMNIYIEFKDKVTQGRFSEFHHNGSKDSKKFHKLYKQIMNNKSSGCLLTFGSK
ncbi:MAG: replication initiation protein [Bacteroidaceae bacterium]|nr:replication initiation protein [Bacteroidaceae bacterium]